MSTCVCVCAGDIFVFAVTELIPRVLIWLMCVYTGIVWARAAPLQYIIVASQEGAHWCGELATLGAGVNVLVWGAGNIVLCHDEFVRHYYDDVVILYGRFYGFPLPIVDMPRLSITCTEVHTSERRCRRFRAPSV